MYRLWNPTRIACLLLLLAYATPWIHRVTANDFAGANSYFLYALDQPDRLDVLDAMQSANMKLLRVFITIVAEGNKGSSASAVNDLETIAVGQYDDNILRQIDTLASEAHPRDIKLVIAMHDRRCTSVPDSSAFYTNADAIADYDNRLRHILNFQSPNFGVPWHQLSDAIFAFEIENEAMGHMDQVAPDWWCGRANTIRDVLGNTGIQISTGGGTDLPTSLQSQFWGCENLQIIALHDYNLDSDYVASHVDNAKPLAIASGKRMLYEEFGATGGSKASSLQSITDLLIKTGVPWMFWELNKPGAGANDYEIWTDEDSWSVLRSQSLVTNQQGGEFGWPEIDGGSA